MKTGTKIYGRTRGDERDEPDTATTMVGKQHIILLWKRNTHEEWQWEKAAFLQYIGKHSILLWRRNTQEELQHEKAALLTTLKEGHYQKKHSFTQQ